MSTTIDNDLLDTALRQLAQGRPAADILASYPAAAVELGPLLNTAGRLEALRLVRLPSAQSATADRNAFLAQVT